MGNHPVCACVAVVMVAMVMVGAAPAWSDGLVP